MIKELFSMLVPDMRLMFDKGSSAPPAPDPNTVSAAQTKSNIDTARLNARLNRVNQVTPYGSLTYSQNQTPTFDEAGYNKAMDAWQKAQQTPTAPTPVYGQGENGFDQVTGYTGGTQGNSTPMPTRDQFMSPGSDDWTATINLSPEQQKLLDSDNRIKAQLGAVAESGLARVNTAMGQPFDTSQLTAYRDMPQGGGAQSYNPTAQSYTRGLNAAPIQYSLPNSDYANQRSAVEQAFLSRVNPQLDKDRAALEQRLANQGIAIGSDAYKNALSIQNQKDVDAYNQAVLLGGQEQSRLAGLDLAAGNFANSAQAQNFGQQATQAALNNSVNDTLFNQGLQTTAFNNQANQQNFAQQIAAAQANNAQRQQQMQEQSYLRSLPLNELNALRTGSQVVNPSFTPTPGANVANTDVSGNIWNAYNQQVAAANAQQAGNNSFLGGLFSLGSAAPGAPATSVFGKMFLG